MTLHVARYYADHEDRVATREYRHTRYQLIEVENHGCWICGTRKGRECHHFDREWADRDATDWRKFIALHPTVIDWNTGGAPKIVTMDWSIFGGDPSRYVDSRWNMMILCALHHRHINHGIHCMPFPDWKVQRCPRQGFVFTPDRRAA